MSETKAGTPFDWLRRYREENLFWRTLGPQIVAVEEGSVRMRLRVEDWMLNRKGGSVNAGLLSSLMDVTGAATVMSTRHAGDGLRQGTVELSISYLAPGAEGDLIAEGRVLRRGQNLVVVQIDVTNPAGKRIATGRGTYFLAPANGGRPPTEGRR